MALAYEWNYDRQIEKYTTQFLRIFSGIQVRDGVKRNGSYKFRRVPVMFGDPTRIVAHVLNKRRTFTNPVVPMMAGHIRNLSIDTERRGPNKYHKEVISTENTDGSFSTHQRLLGPSMTLEMELSIYASSNDETLQILEQILLIFNPKITIQKSEDVLDHNYLTQIELTGITNEIQSPLSTSEKVFLTSMQFEMPVRLNYPHLSSDGIIEQIITNIFDETVEIEKLDDMVIDETGIFDSSQTINAGLGKISVAGLNPTLNIT